MNGLTERYNSNSLWRLYKNLIHTHQICVTKQFIRLPNLLRIGNINKDQYLFWRYSLHDYNKEVYDYCIKLDTLQGPIRYDINYSKGKSLFTNQVLIRFLISTLLLFYIKYS